MRRLRDLARRSGRPRHEAANRERGTRARAHLARARERERRRLAHRDRERERSRRLGGAPDPRPRIRRVAFVVVSLALGIGLAALQDGRGVGWLGPELGAVDTIAVQGQDRLTSGEIAAATGVARGSALASVDPAAVEARLSALPWIAEADVLRLPPATLLVRVREREPRALLVAQAADGNGRLVDETGAPFDSAPIADELPLLVGGGALASGERYEVLAEALELLAALDAAGIQSLADDQGRVALHLPESDSPEGWVVDGAARVVLGHDGLEGRLGRLAELLRSDVLAAREDNARLRIDLRFAQQAVLRDLSAGERG